LVEYVNDSEGCGGGATVYDPQFVEAIAGYDSTLGEQIPIDAGVGVTLGISLPTNSEADGGGWFKTPVGFVGTLTVTPVMTYWDSSGGDIRVYTQYKVYPIDGENGTYTSGTETTATLPAGSGTPSAGDALSLTDIAASIPITADSIVMLNMVRVGDDVLDDYPGSVSLMGFNIEYGA
jgi:hypothetical protein